jgi:hypothetical protein
MTAVAAAAVRRVRELRMEVFLSLGVICTERK